MPELSIVIPAYNEENRLPSTLKSIYKYFADQGTDFEIIIVNDGSKDNTADLVEQAALEHQRIKLINHTNNRGKGFAIKVGVLSALGDLILTTDADKSSPIEEYERLLTAIKNGADLSIGSRAKHDRSRTVSALPYRTYIGNTFNRIVQSLLLPGIYDTQCGFKLYKKSVAHDLFSFSTIDGYAFDVEILYLAKLRNYRIEETAINWTNAAGSKVNVLTDSFKMLAEVLKISRNAAQGKYLKSKVKEINECNPSTK